MNQQDIEICLLDKEIEQLQRLEHINKMRAKRQNVRRPTIKHPQAKIESTSLDDLNNDYTDNNVSQAFESKNFKNEITEPIKEPIIRY